MLLYATQGASADGEFNALELPEHLLRAPRLEWRDVRRHAQGVVRARDQWAVWTGAWSAVPSDDCVVAPDGDGVLRALLLSPHAPPMERHVPLADPAPPPSTASSSAGGVSSTEVMFDVAAERAKKATASFVAGFSSFVATASSKAQEAAALAKEKSQQVETVGEYKVKVVRKLAEGGFSEVFSVRGPNNEPWALKRCRAQTSEQMAQLAREVKCHQLVLTEPHVLRLIASDVAADGRGRSQVRFLFPLCDGGSWYDMAYGKDVDEAESLRIGLGATRGLRALHLAGMLHRDVKPHNILLARGEPLLMDLGSCGPNPTKVPSKGAAVLLQEEAAEQCSAPYRAPELYEPAVGADVDAACDVWSMGCSLFAGTYGRGWPPYEDAAQGVLKLAILNASPIKFPEHSRYSERVKRIVLGTVQRSPAARPSVDALIGALEDALAEAQRA